VLLGLNNSAIYVGVALGGVLGGLLQGQLTPARLGLVAAGVSVIGLLVNLTTARRTAVGTASGR
jgi:predicted MFS family arabinose efflux permease